MRPGVIGHDLEVIGHAAVELDSESIVVGADAAKDFRHGAEIRVGPRGGNLRNLVAARAFNKGGGGAIKRCRVSRSRERAPADVVCDVGDRGPGVGIYEVRETTTEAAQITDGDDRISGNLALDGEVGLLDGGRLEVFVEKGNAQCGGCGGWVVKICGKMAVPGAVAAVKE